ncbi:MAG: CarD family transcriptional regulator [Thermoanaerobaculia bacterium]|nr:CarD family transcriptional regulator [Thermoanaerobaculia bacterium]
MTAFKVGQKLVYPSHGVTKVEKIEPTKIDGTEETFYHLRVLSNDSKVMVPEQNLDLVGLRALCGPKEIKELLDHLGDGNIDTYKDWKGRYKQNLDKMKTGTLLEVARVLKNLRLVATKKSLSFREKKMYERAKYFLVSEIAHVRGIDEDEADRRVEEALASSIDKRAAARAKEKAKASAEAVAG